MLPWRWLKAASAEPCITNLRILLAKSVLPICSWDWQISEPAFYEAIAPSDGCTDGFASRVREFANSIRSFLRHGAAGGFSTALAVLGHVLRNFNRIRTSLRKGKTWATS